MASFGARDARERIEREIEEIESALLERGVDLPQSDDEVSTASDATADSLCVPAADGDQGGPAQDSSPCLELDGEQTSLHGSAAQIVSSDEEDDGTDELPEDLQTCLSLNLLYQELLQERLQCVDHLIAQNEEQQEAIEKEIDGDVPSSSEKTKLHPMGCFQRSYFQDPHTGEGPPSNPETQEKASMGSKTFKEYSLRKWTEKEKKLIQEAVMSDSLYQRMKPFLNRMERLEHKLTQSKDDNEALSLCQQIEKLKAEVETIKALPDRELLGGREEPHDWEKIANVDMDAMRQSSEVQKFWHHEGHPDVNFKEWCGTEIQQLLEISEKHGNINWQVIASELSTGRTAFQCLQQYQKINGGFRKSVFTEQEDTVLTQLVNKWRIGNHIPFTRIAFFMDGRSAVQLSHRWYHTLNPEIRHGSWTRKEDKLLIEAARKYGRCWYMVREEVPGRSASQCRERYMNSLNCQFRRGTWSHTELEKLIQLVKKHGVGNWAKISEEMVNRTDSQCYKRWTITATRLSESRKPRAKNFLEHEPPDPSCRTAELRKCIARRRKRRRNKQSHNEGQPTTSPPEQSAEPELLTCRVYDVNEWLPSHKSISKSCNKAQDSSDTNDKPFKLMKKEAKNNLGRKIQSLESVKLNRHLLEEIAHWIDNKTLFTSSGTYFPRRRGTYWIGADVVRNKLERLTVNDAATLHLLLKFYKIKYEKCLDAINANDVIHLNRPVMSTLQKLPAAGHSKKDVKERNSSAAQRQYSTPASNRASRTVQDILKNQMQDRMNNDASPIPKSTTDVVHVPIVQAATTTKQHTLSFPPPLKIIKIESSEGSVGRALAPSLAQGIAVQNHLPAQSNTSSRQLSQPLLSKVVRYCLLSPQAAKPHILPNHTIPQAGNLYQLSFIPVFPIRAPAPVVMAPVQNSLANVNANSSQISDQPSLQVAFSNAVRKTNCNTAAGTSRIINTLKIDKPFSNAGGTTKTFRSFIASAGDNWKQNLHLVFGSSITSHDVDCWTRNDEEDDQGQCSFPLLPPSGPTLRALRNILLQKDFLLNSACHLLKSRVSSIPCGMSPSDGDCAQMSTSSSQFTSASCINDDIGDLPEEQRQLHSAESRLQDDEQDVRRLVNDRLKRDTAYQDLRSMFFATFMLPAVLAIASPDLAHLKTKRGKAARKEALQEDLNECDGIQEPGSASPDQDDDSVKTKKIHRSKDSTKKSHRSEDSTKKRHRSEDSTSDDNSTSISEESLFEYEEN
uniref:snRNA-activating protein complex subunit 4 isoform X2 n=1 Tax=Myxine glutinosa TaxID=7769 RepID=UPI00358F98EB